MACLDWSRCAAVERAVGTRDGAWVLRDTRRPVSVVFNNLEAGAIVGEIVDWFHLSKQHVTALQNLHSAATFGRQ